MSLINCTPFMNISNDILFGRDGFNEVAGSWNTTTPGDTALISTGTFTTYTISDAVNFLPDYSNYDIEFELIRTTSDSLRIGLGSNASVSGFGEYYNGIAGDIRTKTGAIFHTFPSLLVNGDKLRFIRTSSPSHNLEIILNDVTVKSSGIANSGYTPYMFCRISVGGTSAAGNGFSNFRQINV